MSAPSLKKVVELPLKQTKEQFDLLKKVFNSINEKAEGEKRNAIEGLIRETDGIIEKASGVALEAALIAAAQAVVHYEIAHYGTLRE